MRALAALHRGGRSLERAPALHALVRSRRARGGARGRRAREPRIPLRRLGSARRSHHRHARARRRAAARLAARGHDDPRRGAVRRPLAQGRVPVLGGGRARSRPRRGRDRAAARGLHLARALLRSRSVRATRRRDARSAASVSPTPRATRSARSASAARSATTRAGPRRCSPRPRPSANVRRTPIVELFWKVHPWLYRISGGRLLGELVGMKVLLLTTTGAKSGAQRTTALTYLEADGAYVVIGSFLGEPRHPAWVHNLRANPRATCRSASRRIAVTRARGARRGARAAVAATRGAPARLSRVRGPHRPRDPGGGSRAFGG